MMLHFLNDVVNDIDSTRIDNYVIIARLNSEQTSKGINRIPGSHLLISINFTRPHFENAF